MNARTGDQTQTATELAARPKTDPRWNGVGRDYAARDIIALRGRVQEEHTVARRGWERRWSLIHPKEWVPVRRALTRNQATQQVRARLEVSYLSSWQVAADANLSGQTYPDQSLYPANSVPNVVRLVNNALLRADQIETAEGIAAGVHWEDQLAREKKRGQMGGNVLVPTGQHNNTLGAARLAADVAGVSSIMIARTDSLAGFLAFNHSIFTLSQGYSRRGKSAYVELQEVEVASESDGYTATQHQREVGTGYFDTISTVLNPGSATLALVGSTESE